MSNKYPWWKYLIIVLVVLFGAFYAAPNFYREDSAIQITGSHATIKVNANILARAESALKQADISFKFGSLDSKNTQALIRLDTQDDQLKAQGVISRALGDNFITALTMATNVPAWLQSAGAQPMKLGLDLRGGVHFLLEVDLDAVLHQRLGIDAVKIKTLLRQERVRFTALTLIDKKPEDQAFNLETVNSETVKAIRITLGTEALRNKADEVLQEHFSYYTYAKAQDNLAQRFYLDLSFKPEEVKAIENYAIEQNLSTLRNRVNELGVASPVVQQQGRNRIVVELPGVQDAAAAKRVLGTTANLEFRLEALSDNRSLAESFNFRNQPYRKALLERDVIIGGDNIVNAAANYDQNGRHQVQVTLDNAGGQNMYRVTRDAVGRNMGVVFIEHKSRTLYKAANKESSGLLEIGQASDKQDLNTQKYIEKGIISLARIQSPLSNQFVITGLDSQAEASELALLLRAGALAAPIYFLEERTIGPSLGKANIEAGLFSIQLGLVLVFLFMLVYYKVFGLIADLALIVNLLLVVALMSLLSATLTLPGIAGIVLTVGMSVDANVLIFARIKEELRSGASIRQSINAGYSQAFVTILDANITTLLVALVLFAIGTGPIKGFALTLSLGIVTSFFTAIMFTRAMVSLIYGGRKVKRLYI